jgi:hypothetical protein
MASRIVAGGGIQSESISDFDPRTLAGCVLWLDAADSNTVFTDTAGTTLAGNGNTVARWNDKSNSQCNATQSTAGSRPAYVTNQAVKFTGVVGVGTNTQQFTFTNTSVFPVGTSPATYFIVTRPYSGNQILSYGSYSAGNPTHRTFASFGGAINIIRFAYETGSIDISDASRRNASSIISSVLDNALTTSLFVNGGLQQRRDLMSTVPTFNTGSSSFVLGDFLVGGNPYYGDISEVIMFNRALQNDERQQVEGYLAWKWGMINTLPVTHPYYYAKAPQSAFQPTSFPSCALWLDAADRNSISSNVTQWNDKSGNNRHFVAAGSSPTPIFSNTGFLGAPGIQFTRASATSRAVLEWTNNATPLVTSDITVMMLVRTSGAVMLSQDRLLSTASTINGSDIVSGGDRFGFVNRLGTYSTVFRNNNSNATSPSITSLESNEQRIITMTINKSTLTSTIRRTHSSSVTITGSRTGESNIDLSLRQIRLGTSTSVQNGTNDFDQATFQGFISEVLIYNSVLSTTQLENLEGYIAWKYKLASSLLHSTHPYSVAAPVGVIPTSMAGSVCQLWLDASDLTTLSLNVTQWNDKSGLGNNATPTATAPTFSGNFVACGNNSGFTTPAMVLSATSKISVFVVANQLTTVGTGNLDLIRGNPYPNFTMNLIDGINAFGTYINDESGQLTTYTTINKVAIYEMVYDAATVRPYVTGNAQTSYSRSPGTALTTSQVLSIAGNATTNLRYNEILFFDVELTTTQRQQVEGYLGWKLGLQSDLPATHPFTLANYFFNNTRPMTRNFVPPDIDGCQLWIDAADSSVVTLNSSGNVTSIADKSGLENNVSNAGSTVTYASTLNSRPVLSFPSTGTVAGNILSTASLTRDPVNYSAFYVCRYPSSGANPIQAINFDLSTATSTTLSGATNAATSTLTVGSTSGFAVGRYIIITGVTPSGYNQIGLITAISSSTQLTVNLARGAPGVNYTSGGTVTQLTASHMFGQDGIVPSFNIQNVNYEAGTATRATTSFVYSSPTLINNTFVLGCVRQNGVFTFSTNGIAHTTASSGFTAIGHKTTGAYSIFGGVQGLNIAEVIVYNSALTDAERQTIEGYLAWKWGIQRATSSTNPSVTSGLTYPTTHPYYNFPPVDVTPMTPALRLYKKPFDPSDLSPDLWLDSQDLSTIGVDANNRLVRWNSKGTATSPEFSIPSYVGSDAGFDGPLLSTSKIGAGSNMRFLDFSPGGVFPIAQANITSANEMVLTLGSPTTSYNTSSGSIEAYSISITSGTTTTTTATINFTGNTTNVPPFPVGSFVTFTDTSNTGTPALNGNVYTVVTATPTQVTFSVSGTTGTVTGGTISPSSTSGTVTAQNLAIVNYTNDDVQPFVAGQSVNLSGGTFNGLTDIRLIRATSRSIQFLTTISVRSSITNGTVALVNPPHNIPANRQITLAFSSAQFNNGVDAAFIGRTYDGSTSISCSFTGSISSTTLTVGTVTSGFVSAGMTLTGTGITGSVVTSVQTGANTWTVTNPNSITVSSITISGASTIFPIVGSGTPYIVTSVATNTITLTLPHSIPSIQQGIMHFVNGHVSYGTIIPRSIQVPASAGLSTITTLTAHGLVNGDNINLNFIGIGALSGISNPTNAINFNGYYSVSGITSSTLNTFRITLIQQIKSNAGAAPTYNGTGGTTLMSSPSGQNTASTISFPVKAYCLERRDGTGISSNNVSVVFVTHNVTPPTRTGVFSSIQPVMFGTTIPGSTANSGEDTNFGITSFAGIGRDFAVRLASFAGTAQRYSVKKNGANTIPLFPANSGRAATDDNSGFRLITVSINTGSTAIEDIPGVTTALAINGGRNELTFNNVNTQNQVTTAFRIIGIQTNGSSSMTIAYTGLMVAGQNPFTNNVNFTISGFSTSGFNNAYTSVTSTAAGIPGSNPFYGSITVTACTPAINTLATSGTYMSTTDTGLIFPTTRTTTLSTGQIRIGADMRANTGSGTNGISGTDAGLSNYCYDGGISEILVFNSILSVERRQLLEGYLAQKYRSVTNTGASYNYLGSTAVNLYNNTTLAVASGGATCASSATTIGGLSLFLVTLTHASGTIQYQQGLSITVSGITPSGYNGTWPVVYSTASTVQYYVSATLVTSTVAGSITAGTAQTNTFIHPYRLNPTNITGQNTLDLTSTTSPYAQSLVAWFDAANPNLINNANITTQANATPPTNNTAVTRWAPTSGWWANTPLQLANPVGTVTYFSTTSGNGLPGIYLGGETSTLSLATATGAFSQYATISSNSNFTWMVVFRPDSVSSTQPVISVTSGSSNRLMLCSDGTFIYSSNGTITQTLTLPAGHALTSGKTHMITVYRDGTTLGYRIVSEDTTRGSGGFAAGTATQSNLAIPTFNTPTLTFGASTVTSYTTSFRGTIFEAALFRSAMTLQSMQQVGGYLAWKWGLQNSLPSGHAYKRISA